MGEATVSVIVPVHNADAYVSQALDSLARQTLGERVEVVVVLDAPTDDSASVVRQHERIANFRVIELAANAGPSAARNIGIEHSTAEFVGFLDADDWVDSTMYEKLVDAARRVDADVASCGYARVSADGGATPVPFPVADCDLSNPALIREQVSSGHSSRMLWFAVRSIFRRANLCPHPFDPDLRMGEDVVFNLRAFSRAQRVAVVDEALYFYREVATSATMHTGYNPDLASGLQRAYARKLEIAEEVSLPGAFRDDVHLYTIENLVPRLLVNARRDRLKTPREAVEEVLALPMVRDAVRSTSLRSSLPNGQRAILAMAKARQASLLARFSSRMA